MASAQPGLYDNASRRTSETGPRGAVAFGYSDRNEVNSVTEPSGSPFSDQSFTYDAGYNRSNWTSGTTSTAYTVNNLNQYTAVASASPSWNGDGGWPATTATPTPTTRSCGWWKWTTPWANTSSATIRSGAG